MDKPCETCGHDITKHIYHEGACRPGFVCPCTQYVETQCGCSHSHRECEEMSALRAENLVLKKRLLDKLESSVGPDHETGEPVGVTLHVGRGVIEEPKECLVKDCHNSGEPESCLCGVHVTDITDL